MTVKKGRETGAMDSSSRFGTPCELGSCAVKMFLFLCFVACFSITNTQQARESRKLFGGYRITPSYCKASRASRYNHGSTICMFNHECTQRGGEVVGACMDGFLFGACCQLKEDNHSHIPKGPGVVMTSYLDYPSADSEDEIEDSDQLAHWHNSFKPVIKPGYKPTEKYDALPTKLTNDVKNPDHQLSSSARPPSTETINNDFSEGLSQISNSLLNSPPKDSDVIYIRPHEKPGIYSHSTISHEGADTILLHRNGSEADDIARPSDFNIQISSMQTKPTVSPNRMSTTTTTTPKTVSTHIPIYGKPVFKPKPSNNKYKPTLVTKGPPSKQSAKPVFTTEKYIQVATVSKETNKTPGSYQSSSFDTIIQMLNESTPSIDKVEDTTQSVPFTSFNPAETKSSPSTYIENITPDSYTSGYPNLHFSTGHYVTLKPSTNYVHSSTVSIQSSPDRVSLPHYTQTSKPVYVNNKYSTSPNSVFDEDRITTTNYVSSSKPSTYYSSSWSTNRPTSLPLSNEFNKYSTVYNEVSEEDRITTMSYVSTTSSTRRPPSTTTRKPPSTSYVFGSKPSKRPISATSNLVSYDSAPDTFSSVTPTVIVLNGFTPRPEQEYQQNLVTEDASEGDNGFVEISQEPFKKPVNQVTINNIISSTHNIHVGKPAYSDERPDYLAERPSSPTVVITPKPTQSPNEDRRPTKPPLTTPLIHTSTSFKVKPLTSVAPIRYTTDSPTTLRPELQTSPDDLINFPPVRNPMLNASGSNPGLYNTSISMSGDDLILQEVEFTTPSFLQEDEVMNDKMNLFVNKIVGSLQGTFQELHDIVILDKKPNITATKPDTKVTTAKPVRKPAATTKKPTVTSKRPPVKLTTTTKKPTKKPVRSTSTTKKPAASTQAPTTKKPATTTKKSRPTKVTTTQTPSTTTEQYDEITTEQYSSSTIDYSNKDLCGVRPLSKSGRIVGGKGATFGDFPWQVLVRESTWLGLFTKNKCGGVLITNRFVTTAAHCQPGFLGSLVAVFGEHDISGDLEKKRPVSRNVRRVVVHRQYDAATFENDLALLELESPIHFDAHIVPICMPPDEADFTGRMATVTGWGRLKYGGGVPAVLQEVQVPVIENSVCQEMFQTAGHTKIILNSFLCAGYANGQKDSCEGDSGGPLVLQRPDGRWQLVGTVSHGIKCAAPYLPGVYMRTTYYKPWLKGITGVH